MGAALRGFSEQSRWFVRERDIEPQRHGRDAAGAGGFRRTHRRLSTICHRMCVLCQSGSVHVYIIVCMCFA